MSGQAHQGRFTSGEFFEAPVQLHRGQPEAVQNGPGAFLDVPVGAHRLEVFLAYVTRLDGPQRAKCGFHPQRVCDGAARLPGNVLGHVTQPAVHRDGAGGGLQVPGDEARERGFARAVDADEARATGGEGGRETIEHLVADGPGEGEIGADGGGGRSRHRCPWRLGPKTGRGATSDAHLFVPIAGDTSRQYSLPAAGLATKYRVRGLSW